MGISFNPCLIEGILLF